MMVLLHDGVDQATVDAVIARAEELGLSVAPVEGRRGRALAVSGPELGRALALRGTPGVAEILTRRTALAGGEPLWPHFVLRVTTLFLLLLATLALLAGFLPPGLGDDGGAVRDHAPTVTTEWYLRAPSAIDDRLGSTGLLLLGLLWAALLFMPLVDRFDAQTPAGRTGALAVRVLGLAVVAALVLLGVVGSP
ncbi:MAG: hypothetical protein H6825_11260 [Planctomycetes bacterium]|nr:hypothetical protein [Planctomycetota bacterium]